VDQVQWCDSNASQTMPDHRIGSPTSREADKKLVLLACGRDIEWTAAMQCRVKPDYRYQPDTL